MNIKELRIGNFVNLNGKPTEFEIMDFNLDPSFISPIKITEEWLFRFGFKEILLEDGVYGHNIGDFVYIDGIQIRDIDNEGIFLSDYVLKYVHQLQNMYFALTNEELKINTDDN